MPKTLSLKSRQTGSPIPPDPSDAFMATTTIGPRGQIVIPKELRDQLGLKPGSTIMCMRNKNGPVLLFPVEHMRAFLDRMEQQLLTVNKK